MPLIQYTRTPLFDVHGTSVILLLPVQLVPF